MKRAIINLGTTFACSLVLMSNSVFAADVNDIEQAELRLLKIERQMLQDELKLDRAVQDYTKFKGIRGWIKGWFNRSEKKALKELKEKLGSLVDEQHHDIKRAEHGIQAEVFNVGQSFEKKGDYQRAIEFYMKVTNKTDNVKLRIGTCYQLMKEFKKAVKWYLKMAHTDRNYLYVVDAYWEAGEKKETTEWLFRILQGFNGSDAEERALVLMDKYDYPERMKDFPNYDGRMSRIYVRRALANFSGNYDMAVASYKKAVSLTAKDGDMIRASMRILTVYEEEKENAQRKLDDKREEANDHYQYKLRQAEDRLRRAEHAYDRAIHEAENDYRWAIQAARNEQNEARRNLERMRNNSAATDLDLQNAKDRVRRAEQKFAYLYHNKAEFIDNEVYYERNKVREARRDYDHIMNSRHQIIEEYIRPYKRELAATTERYKKIRNLHQNIR